MTAAVLRRFPIVEAGARPTPVIVARIGPAEIIVGPITNGRCDLELIDTLARMHLAAVRLGGAIRVRDACPKLSGLLDLVGLADLLVEDG